jgi:hypothetical protein
MQEVGGVALLHTDIKSDCIGVSGPKSEYAFRPQAFLVFLSSNLGVWRHMGSIPCASLFPRKLFPRQRVIRATSTVAVKWKKDVKERGEYRLGESYVS